MSEYKRYFLAGALAFGLGFPSTIVEAGSENPTQKQSSPVVEEPAMVVAVKPGILVARGNNLSRQLRLARRFESLCKFDASIRLGPSDRARYIVLFHTNRSKLCSGF